MDSLREGSLCIHVSSDGEISNMANSHGAFTTEFNPKDSELDIFLAGDAEGGRVRFALSALSSV